MEEVEKVESGERLLNVRETAALLNVGRQTIFNWRSQGKIPYTKLGGRLLFRLADLQKFIKVNTVEAKHYGRN